MQEHVRLVFRLLCSEGKTLIFELICKDSINLIRNEIYKWRMEKSYQGSDIHVKNAIFFRWAFMREAHWL